MHDIKSNVKLIEVLEAKQRSANTYKSNAIDMSLYGSGSLLASYGAFGASATAAFKLQMSDTTTDGDFVDEDGATGNSTTSGSKTSAGSTQLDIITPQKRYYRVVATTAVQTVDFGVVGAFGPAAKGPVA